MTTSGRVPELAEMEERARAATRWSPMTMCTPSTTPVFPQRCCPASTSTGGGRKQRHLTPELLTFTRDELVRSEDLTNTPTAGDPGTLSLPLSHRFEPGATDDGVTVHVPVEVLARLGGDAFAWQVPALREELVTA